MQGNPPDDPFETTEPTPPPPPAYAPPSAAGMRCTTCHRDLSGATLGSGCPHCGAPIVADPYHHTRQSSGMAIASMVLGIIAVVASPGGFCCSCLTGVGGVCGLIAVILYFPAVAAVRDNLAPESSRKMALAGLVCGSIGLLLSLGSLTLTLLYIL